MPEKEFRIWLEDGLVLAWREKLSRRQAAGNRSQPANRQKGINREKAQGACGFAAVAGEDRWRLKCLKMNSRFGWRMG